MSRELADWLNRIGMALGFVSFWLVAPEFIGEDRLRLWEDSLAAGLLQMPKVLKVIFISMSIVAILIYLGRVVLEVRTGHIVFPEVPQALTLATGMLAATLLAAQILVEPVVSRLANDNHVRQTALLLGAALFIFSFVLQFIATFQQSPDH
jgi:hypothetical protein